MGNFKSACYRLICLHALISLPFVLSAQNITAVSPERILEQRQEVFRKINAFEDPFEDSLWYQGRIYEFKVLSLTGSPYFFELGPMPGSATYSGKTYEDLLLTYNLITDELILWETGFRGNMMQLVLNKYFAERFTMKYNGNIYHFRLHTEMKPIHEDLKEGFYEVINDDELRMFVKHQAELSYDATNVEYYSYEIKKQVYLISDEEIYVINSRRDYLKAFQDEKKSLRKYMSQKSINFDRSDTQALLELCTYTKSFLNQ
jgi:hypothetical protein